MDNSLTAHNQDVAVADRVLLDAQGDSHHQVSFVIGVYRKGKKHRNARECTMCKSDGSVKRNFVDQFCFECQQLMVLLEPAIKEALVHCKVAY
jgi:hypothetical protein